MELLIVCHTMPDLIVLITRKISQPIKTNLLWIGCAIIRTCRGAVITWHPRPTVRPPAGPGNLARFLPDGESLPIYVGQQDPHTATDTYNPSSILTAQQGNIDGNAAISLMLSEGFPEGSFVYLDWEYGAIDEQGPSGDYVKSWISAVAADGKVLPGVYCSHVAAQAIVRLIDAYKPNPDYAFLVLERAHRQFPSFYGGLSQHSDN